MKRKDELIVVDFDGTLFFTEKCMRLAAKDVLHKDMTYKQIRALPVKIKSGVYDVAFTKYNHHSILNTKLHRILESSKKSEKMILTARKNNTDTHIKGLLKKHKVKVDRLLSRKPQEMHLDDEVWKADILSNIVGKYKRIELYEDKMENIEHIRKHLNPKNMAFYIVTSRSIRRVR